MHMLAAMDLPVHYQCISIYLAIELNVSPKAALDGHGSCVSNAFSCKQTAAMAASKQQ